MLPVKYSQMHVHCEKCGSSDAASVFADDGTHQCFSCGARWRPKGSDGTSAKPVAGTAPSGQPLIPHESIEIVDIPSRRISASTCERFRYGIAEARNAVTGEVEPCQVAPFFDSTGRLIAQKLRFAADARGKKNFAWRGDAKAAGLFGMNLWAEKGRRIVITEGEVDALSVVEGYRSCAAVSLKNGAGQAVEEISSHIDYLNEFDEVVLAFDMDEAGQKATEAVVSLFTPGKVKIAYLPAKDANDVLRLENGAALLRQAIWEARTYRPEGIVEGIELLDSLTQPRDSGVPYPWPCLNSKLLGQRRGEIVTWTAGTGIGKSTIVRLIAQDLHIQHGQRVGVISLEESKEEAALAQVGAFMGKPLHLPGEAERVGAEAIQEAGSKVLRGMFFYDAVEAGIAPDVILPKLRYMVHSLGVRWIVLDHITMMVGAAEKRANEATDELMWTIRQAATQLQVGIHVVCQLRKVGTDGKSFEEGGSISLDDMKGSGSIKQYSNGVVALERNQQALDGKVANRVTLKVLKNRFNGLTGVCGRLRFDHDTLRLQEVNEEAEKKTRKGFGSGDTSSAGVAPSRERGDF